MAAVPRKGVVYYEDGDDTDIKNLLLKRARVCEDNLNSAQPTVTVQDVLARADTRVLPRRVYFLNEERYRYVSMGLYPSDNYEVLAGFGGPRIALSPSPSITSGRWRKPCRRYAMLCNAVNYTRAKTVPFVYVPAKPMNVLDCIATKSVSFTLTDLRYMMSMPNMVEAQQSQYILAQADVMSYAYGVLGSLVFAKPPRSNASLIPYDRLFEELKLRLNRCR